MHLGFLTDGLGHRPFVEVLGIVADLGLSEIELTTGNWSRSPHVDLELLLADGARREKLSWELADHGLHIGALNASGNPLHPITGSQHDAVTRDTIRLAGLLDVHKIVMMSGLPAVYEGDRTAPWITTCWPPENVTNRQRQWEAAVEYWRNLVAFAHDHGVDRIAVEMHADQLVYNAPTLLRLREAVGGVVGANMDPSHLMWMGADPVASVKLLGDAVYHVHAKDARIEAAAAVRTHLETLPFKERGERAWNYVTLGEGHPGGVEFWQRFCRALQQGGYDGVLSIEHEDVAYTAEEGLRRSAALLGGVLG